MSGMLQILLLFGRQKVICSPLKTNNTYILQSSLNMQQESQTYKRVLPATVEPAFAICCGSLMASE